MLPHVLSWTAVGGAWGVQAAATQMMLPWVLVWQDGGIYLTPKQQKANRLASTLSALGSPDISACRTNVLPVHGDCKVAGMHVADPCLPNGMQNLAQGGLLNDMSVPYSPGGGPDIPNSFTCQLNSSWHGATWLWYLVLWGVQVDEQVPGAVGSAGRRTGT